MESCLLVQKNLNGRAKFISIKVDGDTVSREWGIVGGKTQTTSNTYDFINKGKANQLDPIMSAKADYDRIIATKTKEGYMITESLEMKIDLNANSVMNFKDLPTQFCCSKPNTSIAEKKADALIKKGLGKFFIKANGMCHFILVTPEKKIKIYTRRMDDHTTKYPAIVEAAEILDMPPNTLLITEFIVDPVYKLPHMAGFKAIAKISRSDTVKGKVKEDVSQTLKLQEQYPIKAMVFNVLYWDSEDLTSKPYKTILEHFIYPLCLMEVPQDGFIVPTLVSLNSYAAAMAWAEENRKEYEGLVLWELDKNAEITYSGKPNRRACYKVKAFQEDDVIAYGYLEGDGDKQGLIGALQIGKYDEQGNIVPMGKCGSGLTDEMCDPALWEFPCVIEIRYDQRFPTGSYQFPRFSKIHSEKVPSEVVVDEDGM